jgi:hypothetical protein
MSFINDQVFTVQKIVDLGIAERVDPATTTKSELKDVIIHVAETQRFVMTFLTKLYLIYFLGAGTGLKKFDKLMSGLETVIWWSEYVMRHKDIKHLTSSVFESSSDSYFNDGIVVNVVIGVHLMGIAYVKQSRKFSKILKCHFFLISTYIY